MTFASTGNAIDFGTALTGGGQGGNCGLSSPVRGIFGGISTPGNQSNVIEFITIASLGTFQDFGDLSSGRAGTAGMCSPTRGLFAGGGPLGSYNVIDYVNIQSTGNATTFGNLNRNNVQSGGGTSNAHGGL